MIYATLFKRYLLPQIGYSVLAALLVVCCVWMFEGFIPLLSVIVFFGVVLFCIPILAYMDYREIKYHLGNLIEIRKGGPIPPDYIEKTVQMAAEKSGIPEFMVAFIAEKAVAKFVPTEKVIVDKAIQITSEKTCVPGFLVAYAAEKAMEKFGSNVKGNSTKATKEPL